MRSAGGNVLPTCRPGSHATSRECIHGARMDGLRGTGRAAGAISSPGGCLICRSGTGAMRAGRLKVTAAQETGKRTCHGSGIYMSSQGFFRIGAAGT